MATSADVKTAFVNHCETMIAIHDPDYVALSTYPILFNGNGDPAALPADYYERLRALAPGKPFAIAESGWPAQDLDAPWPNPIAIDAGHQRAFVELLLDEAERLDAVFVTTFLTRDWDELWDSGAVPETAINRFFRDMGLLDGAGDARPAMDLWRDRLRVCE